MNVNKVIIHFINKEQRSTNIQVEKSRSLLTVDDNVEFLAQRLNEAFLHNNRVIRTEFESSHNIFQLRARNYINDSTNTNFSEFASLSIDRIADLLSSNVLASGGYFVYLDYVEMGRNYLGVFLVRDSEEVIFDKDENSTNFTVNTTNIVNTDKLAMACRINVDGLDSNENRYLHFTRKQTHVSDYFINWIEAELADKSVDDTKQLIKLLQTEITQDEIPLDSDGNQIHPQEFKNRLFDFIESSGRIVRIKEISETFWDNRDFLTNKIENLGWNINDEFQASAYHLKRLKRYEITYGKMKISFTQNDISDGVISEGEEDDQLIIESQELRQKFEELL